MVSEPEDMVVLQLLWQPQSENLDLGLWTHICDSDFGLRISGFGLWTQACKLKTKEEDEVIGNKFRDTFILKENKFSLHFIMLQWEQGLGLSQVNPKALRNKLQLNFL